MICLICMPKALGPAAQRLRAYISGKSLVPMLQLLHITFLLLTENALGSYGSAKQNVIYYTTVVVLALPYSLNQTHTSLQPLHAWFPRRMCVSVPRLVKSTHMK